ncbi:TetR/AcrR family transcriptional regulator [Arthrobacter koreensis]|uniref:TetR/AcrR family transcriptional regulator n=1 Tax=Arthrobacter koreensis TaxID=199136 RepID=UPI002DB81FDC|nr:TetR family transcriptional regulator [Arthrobacter koreensis]MEB7503030.1 TetR family transcriptional regulator [Arthrobacter koreensis]
MTPGEEHAHVIEVADRLFYERGIQAVGMAELRREVDLPLKKLYALFPSKQAIVFAVLDRRHRIWTAGIQERIDAAADPRQKLLAVYDYLSDWFAEDSFRGCAFINAFGELGSQSPDIAERTRTHKESFQRVLAELVAEAGGNPALAPQLALLAEGAQTTAAISGSAEPARQARQAAEILIDAQIQAAPGLA